MSAKPCSRCGGLIVFGHELTTDKVIPLSVGSKVYRVIKEDIVELDPKALVPHICNLQSPPAVARERNFYEPQGGDRD